MTTFFNQTLENRLCTTTEFRLVTSILPPKRSFIIGFVNPFSYMLVAGEGRIVNSFDLWFVDGALLRYLTNIRRTKKLERISFDFSSVAGDLMSLSSKLSLNVALIGGNIDELRRAKAFLESKYPNLRIIFSHHGFFCKNLWSKVIERITVSKPDLIVVGLGSPLQENFVLKLKGSLVKPALLFTCGGFISQTGSNGDYYPVWVNKLGLRWAYRALMEKHVRLRLLKNYPIFVLRYLLERKK